MSLPATYNLDLYRGDDWKLPLEFVQPDETPIDLTGFTLTAQIRKYKQSTDVLAEISVVVDSPTTGEVSLNLAAATVNELEPFGYWDLEMRSPGAVTETWLAGVVRVIDDVTRSL